VLIFLVYLESHCSVRNCSESGECCQFRNFPELGGSFGFVLVFSYSVDLCRLEYCVVPLHPPPAQTSRIWRGLDHDLLGNQVIVWKSASEVSFRILQLLWDFIIVLGMVKLTMVLFYLCKSFIINEHIRGTDAFC